MSMPKRKYSDIYDIDQIVKGSWISILSFALMLLFAFIGGKVCYVISAVFMCLFFLFNITASFHLYWPVVVDVFYDYKIKSLIKTIRRYNQGDIDSVCMYMNHEFGLMPDDKRMSDRSFIKDTLDAVIKVEEDRLNRRRHK